MKKLALALCILGLSTGAGLAQDAEFIDEVPLVEAPETIGGTMNLSLGYLKGEAREFVYDPIGGDTISELIWDISAPILKGEIGADLFPWLSISVGGWTTVAKSDSVMDDYDYNQEYNGKLYTLHSHHDDTDLNFANEWEVALKGWVLRDSNARGGLLMGYRESRYSWTARGGTYDYYGFTGSFDAGVPGIGYRQMYFTPFLGLVAEANYGGFEFGARVRYSPAVKSNDRDNHYLRSLEFLDRGYSGTFFSLEGSMGYYFSEHVKAYVEGTYTAYKDLKGPTLYIDMDTQQWDQSLGNSGGLQNKAYSISIGLQGKY
ncbi:MAG: omptin family outer membrane protease [Methylobacteriaceae bacterium]|jgi:plasminogen activator|nr:omptin family outer membrane protease [Methylobacteriaceae bacterium]